MGPTASSWGHSIREDRADLERGAPRGLKKKASGLSTLANVIRIESNSVTGTAALLV